MSVVIYRGVVGAMTVTILWAELLLAQHKLLAGTIVYSVMLLSLLIYGAYRWETSYGQLIVLTIPAVIRLVALSLPLSNLSPMFAQLMISIPLALMAATLVWLLEVGRFQFSFTPRSLPVLAVLVFIGGGVGFALHQIQPASGVSWDTPLLLAFNIFVLVVGMAFLEEWLFRNIMQTALEKIAGGPFAVISVATIYTILNIEHNSTLFVGAVFLISIALGWIRRMQNGFLSVCLFHSAINIIYFLALPGLQR